MPLKVGPPPKPPRKAEPSKDAEIRGRLEKGTDRLNEALRAAEEKLAKLHLGVTARVKMYVERDEEGRDQDTVYLSYQRSGREWRLVREAERDNPEDPSDWDVKPIVNASREDRLTAAKLIPVLLDELRREAEKQSEYVENTASKLLTFLDSIEEVE